MVFKIKPIRLSTCHILVIGGLFTLAGIAVSYLVTEQIKQQALFEAETKAQIILDRNLAIHTYFNRKLKPKLFDLTNSILQDGYFEPVWMSSTYAVREIEQDLKLLRHSGDYYYKECAVNARSPENEAVGYERTFLEDLKKNPRLVKRSEVLTFSGKPYFVLLRRGEVMEKDCLRCHDTPDKAPLGLVRHYGMERSFHRKLGDIVSAISLRIPLSTAYEEAERFSLKLSELLLTVLLVLFGLQFWIHKRFLFTPLGKIRDKALQISSSGDHLGEMIPYPFGRELKELTAAFNGMSTNLRQNRDHLEARVKERSADLYKANEQLRDEMKERKLAEEALEALVKELEAKNAELERFTYTVAHDLKNPLITIRGFLGLVAKDAAEGDMERMKADLARILGATEKMHLLLDELLELSRVGHLVNPPVEIDLGELVQEALDAVAGRLKERGIQVEFLSELPTIYGETARILEVFENLLNNAVKFMGEQAVPRIQIGARSEGEETIIFVRDNGIGINPRYHEKIFGLFDKVDQKSEGAGAGLAIVKRIVELHGGRVWVESEGDGEGTTFFFSLPNREKNNVNLGVKE